MFLDKTLPFQTSNSDVQAIESQYSSRELNYLLDKDYFENDDGEEDQQNKNGLDHDIFQFEKTIDNMEKQQFKEKFDAKPFEEEEEDEEDLFTYLNKNSNDEL